MFPSQNKVYSVSAPATSLPVNSAGNSSIDDSKLLTMTVSMHRNRSCIQGHSKYKRSRLIHRIPVEPEQEGGTKELISDSESDPEELTSVVESKKVCSENFMASIHIYSISMAETAEGLKSVSKSKQGKPVP